MRTLALRIAIAKNAAYSVLLEYDQVVTTLGIEQYDEERGLFIGLSGRGKTNSLFTLLTHSNGLRYENVYIYSKLLYQPKYKLLDTIYKSMPEIGYKTFTIENDVVIPDAIKSNSIFIFDDIPANSSGESIVNQYFSMGRHKNVDCFYLCQTCVMIPKHMIRDNANFIVVFAQDDINIRHIYDEHVNGMCPFKTFKKLCKLCWKNKHGFLVIDTDCEVYKGRFRRGFDEFIVIEDEDDE